ncbi:hypothetical protein M409DRAFT_25264 [Zasmidium cellare ATCC 36951]|uniref:Methyltransferase domain-containing protein n=1 Tax=Zasmidium cellare ATCC 36951 TaxID=1080233 RepID=A0A6A6CG45_ZASCE|nr:uncharacterized protein M409DRAFT_25264 [Zasmidium cellare ATCC 36951]KAF2164386.1 hypothetical protein M409DRAFT_25264 [Zasmidium cellare ATCC 36951]
MSSDELKTKADVECRRLEAQHDVWKHSFNNQLVFAPLKPENSIRVLDSAGANGYWLQDYRSALAASVRDHPESLFVCTDINPSMLPEESKRNGSIQYVEHSFLDSWPGHLRDSFDLVHQRLAISASGKEPFVKSIKRFASLLKPGSGWLQLVELDTSPDCSKTDGGLAIEDFKHLLHKVTTAGGVRPYFVNGLYEDLGDAGLVDVQQKRIDNRFGKAIHENEEVFQRSIAYPGLAYFAERFMGIAEKMGVGEARFDRLPERLDDQLREKGGTLTAVVVWGRRPA